MVVSTVYAKPGCAQCRAVFRALDDLGVNDRRIDITLDPQARDYVPALGYVCVPVVDAGSDNHFAGFRPDRLRALAHTSAA